MHTTLYLGLSGVGYVERHSLVTTPLVSCSVAKCVVVLKLAVNIINDRC